MYRPKITQYNSSSVLPVYMITCTIIITTTEINCVSLILFTEMLHHYTGNI